LDNKNPNYNMLGLSGHLLFGDYQTTQRCSLMLTLCSRLVLTLCWRCSIINAMGVCWR